MSIKDAKILIIEDEPQINRLIEMVLQSDGYYNIEKAYDGKTGYELIFTYNPDLILLDIMIPELDGYSLCKKVKENDNYNKTPIIMLTAKQQEADIIKGFELGANDYISKPFSNRILLARINAQLQNNYKPEKAFIYKDLKIYDNNKTVYLREKEIYLTKFEYLILKDLICNKGTTFTRSRILKNLRGDNGFDISERAIDVQILNLRRKLGDYGKNIETIRGYGYRLRDIKE